MEYPIYNQSGAEAGKIDLPKEVFGLEMNADLLHQVVTSQMSNRRQVIAHAKGRGEVRGGGKKPWRQKGTGRARHASIRSPLWKGGGATFGPTKERNFKKKINSKMARKALFVALSSKVKDDQLSILEGITMDNIKTKEVAMMYKNISRARNIKSGKTLLVLPGSDNNVKFSARNLPNFSTTEAKNLNALDILAHKNLLIFKDSVAVLKEMANRTKK